MRKRILISLCAVSLLALGCKDPVVKNEMDTAAEHMKEAGHETAEAGRHLEAAGEAAGREAASEIKAEAEHVKSTVSGSGSEPQPPPDTK